MAVFLRQCHFHDLLFYLKSHNLRTENFPLFGFPGHAGVKRNLCRCEIYDVCEIYDPNPNPNPNPIPCEILDVEILDACADSPIVIHFASGEFRATPGKVSGLAL